MEENKMTVFYNIRLGIIDNVVDSEQDMGIYGIFEEDYKKIIDFIVVPRDQMVHNNPDDFHVIDGQLKMKPREIPEQYR